MGLVFNTDMSRWSYVMTFGSYFIHFLLSETIAFIHAWLEDRITS
jgi:hypothetical protein